MPLSCQLQKCLIKFNNKKLKSLQRYDIVQSYRVLYLVVQLCFGLTSKFRTITIFKSIVEENADLSKTCRYSIE
jgi:hypothetical protein